MGITFGMQLEFFIWSAIAGLFSGLLYDFFRAARVLLKPKAVTIMIHDIIFLIVLAIVIFVLSFTVGRGELRFFEFIAIFCGFALYRLAFRDSIVKILVALARFLLKVVIIILKIIIFPLKIIYKTLIKPIRIIIWYVRRKSQKTSSAIKIRRERLARGLKNFKFAAKKK